MSVNELTLPLTGISTQVYDDAVFDDLAKGSGEFLGRLQLFTKGKAIDRGHIRPGHYGIPEGDEEIIDLGDSIDVLVLARRPKAIDMNDKDAIITVYDPKSAEFSRIAAKSMEKESGCMYGPSFLVFEKTSRRFLEFFCGSKSTRNEAKKIYYYLPLSAEEIAARGLQEEPHGPLPMTLKSKLVETSKFSWHVPVALKCSTPFNVAVSQEKAVAEINKFLNPQAETVEKVEEPETGKKKRVR